MPVFLGSLERGQQLRVKFVIFAKIIISELFLVSNNFVSEGKHKHLKKGTLVPLSHCLSRLCRAPLFVEDRKGKSQLQVAQIILYR